MNELLDYVVKSLVSHPDDVKVTLSEQESEISLSLSVNPEDMGVVIGKAGQTIKAIRKLLVVRAMAENPHIRVNLNLEEVAK